LDIDLHSLLSEILTPSETLFPNDNLYPRESTTVDYILIQNGAITVSTDGVARLYTSGAVGLFASYSTIYANEDVMLEVEYSDNLMYVDSLEFLQGKATTTNQFKIKEDGSIEAHNGFFSGRIEADSGYFKGEISWEQITGNEDVATKPYVEGLGYQTAPQVTKITKDTVTTSFIKALNLTVGKEIQMGDNAVISWSNVSNQPTIPKDTSQLTNGAGYTTMAKVEAKGYTTMSAVEGKGYITKPVATQITKDTVTTTYVNALKVKAGSVDAENITGTTIEGKTLKGIKGEIGGFTIGDKAIYNNASSISSTLTGVYIGTDGINLGGKKAVITSTGKASFSDIEITGNGAVDFVYGLSNMHLDYSGIEFSSGSLTTKITSDKVKVYNSYIDQYGLHVRGTLSTYYTDIEENLITFGSGADAYIKQGNSNMIYMRNEKTIITSTIAVLGKYGGKVGFFSKDGSAQKSVTTIASPTVATAPTVATKLNELINALKSYNLIG
jgi:hypothetical protein